METIRFDHVIEPDTKVELFAYYDQPDLTVGYTGGWTVETLTFMDGLCWERDEIRRELGWEKLDKLDNAARDEAIAQLEDAKTERAERREWR